MNSSSPSKSNGFVPVLLVGSVLAVLLLTAIRWSTLARPFDGEPHAWGSAHFATIARSYAEQGFIALRGIPISNNPPLGLEPDAYVHWPPLFSMVLGIVFKLFGVSEAVARCFMLIIGAAVVAVTGWIVKFCYGLRASIAAVFAMVTCPVFYYYVCLVQLTTLGILMMLLSLAAFIKATSDDGHQKFWTWFGLLASLISIWTSWEPALLPVGLLASSLLQRNRRGIGLSLAYGGAILLGAATVFCFYMTSVPTLAGDLWQTALFRTGFGTYTRPAQIAIHSLVNNTYYTFHPTISALARVFLDQFYYGLGSIYLLSIVVTGAFVLKRKDGPGNSTAIVPLVLATPVFLWYFIMSNQAVDNNFEVLLAVPLAAICFPLLLTNGYDASCKALPKSFHPLVNVAVAAILASQIWPMYTTWQMVKRAPVQRTGMLDYASAIGNNTNQDAVVLSPVPSLVPVYYSHRHIIRGINDARYIQFVMERVGTIFPRSPVYLALPPAYLENFRSFLDERHIVFSNGYLVLILLKG